jgi:predicted pyridoxine 5'-phosphate oxidase superfamily flavin-nucleotide-binding protein
MNIEQDSPYHSGEREIQTRAGVRDRAEALGRMSIRHAMPDQHRMFYAQLPIFFVGSADRQQRPWASVIVGRPGFLQSPDPKRLDVNARPLPGDPLNENLHDGALVGALGIEFHTRRRNRVNGKVALTPTGFAINVDQSFGNCPQYIQARLFHPSEGRGVVAPQRVAHIDGDAEAIINRADTFFIASQHQGETSDPCNGVDLSHRGGRPGFVRKIDAQTLRWPDYRGNAFFNTLGNIAADPRCGLLFVDFDSGDVLQLTGRAKVLWEWDKSDPHWQGAGRLVDFTLDEGVLLKEALPLSWDYLSQAPQFAD